jgi:cell division initiation protein
MPPSSVAERQLPQARREGWYRLRALVKYTPLDIRHQEFTNALSGFSKKEVKDFLTAVADDMEEYERQARGFQEKITGLEAQIQELRQGEEALKRAVISAEKIANEIRLNAEREVELKIREAEHQSNLMIADAESAKEKLLREALARARDIRVEIERARSDKAMFLSQFKGLLNTYMDSVERNEDKST